MSRQMWMWPTPADPRESSKSTAQITSTPEPQHRRVPRGHGRHVKHEGVENVPTRAFVVPLANPLEGINARHLLQECQQHCDQCPTRQPATNHRPPPTRQRQSSAPPPVSGGVTVCPAHAPRSAARPPQATPSASGAREAAPRLFPGENAVCSLEVMALGRRSGCAPSHRHFYVPFCCATLPWLPPIRIHRGCCERGRGHSRRGLHTAESNDAVLSGAVGSIWMMADMVDADAALDSGQNARPRHCSSPKAL